MNIKDEEVKKTILEAARKTFQKWGFNKTTMEDIAREAGKGKSTLYYYFKSKEEVLENIAISELSRIIEKSKGTTENLSSSKEKLRIYIGTMLIEFKNTVSIFPLVAGEIKGNKEFLENLRKRVDEREESVVKSILKSGVESGEFHFIKDDEIDTAANVIVGMIRGLMLYLFLDNEDLEKIDIAARIITESM